MTVLAEGQPMFDPCADAVEDQVMDLNITNPETDITDYILKEVL